MIVCGDNAAYPSTCCLSCVIHAEFQSEARTHHLGGFSRGVVPHIRLRHACWNACLQHYPKSAIYSTALTFPVSTSYTHPVMVTLSATALHSRKYLTSSLTASSKSGKGKKSKPPNASAPALPKFASTTLYASWFLKVNMPHPECLTNRTSFVPRSCWEMTMERRASRADAPALRTTWASPREMPKAAAGSMRASIQVTVLISFIRWVY